VPPPRAKSVTRVRLGAKRQLTLPSEAISKMRLKEGDTLELRFQEDRIELIPMALVPRDQLWFWTPEWQAMEQEADQDLAEGRFADFKSAKKAITDLKP
jgi:AbrB family looped-hinge helix DNA binding protein